MTPKKAFFVTLGSLVLITVLTIAGIVFGTSQLKKKSSELVELKLQDNLIEQQQTALIQATKDIEKYQELETIAKTVVPRDKDQAKTVREITTIADQAGIRINSITFPNSNLGTASTPAPATTTEGGSTAPKPQTTPITQVKPVDGIPGLYQLEVTINVDQVAPTYNQLIDFLSRLEQNRRTAQVSSITINPGTNRNLVEFSLIMNVFVKP